MCSAWIHGLNEQLKLSLDHNSHCKVFVWEREQKKEAIYYQCLTHDNADQSIVSVLLIHFVNEVRRQSCF